MHPLKLILYQMLISLENFDDQGRTKPILNSPRSIEACRRQGIEPEQLLVKTLEQIKHIYKDGFNDKKSLEVKLEHYESRRKVKLQLVRKERIEIMSNNRPVYRPNHTSKRSRVEVIEIQDKLHKKKLMDEVKAELKQKQLQLKEAKRVQKLQELQQKKKEEKLRKQWQNVQQDKRKEKNKMEVELERQTKINNYLLTGAQKQAKVEQTLLEKQDNIQQLKRQKETFYDQKTKHHREIQQRALQHKRNKVQAKFSQLDKRKEERERQEALYRKNVEEDRIKDQLWKETKRKEAEIEQQKRQSDIWEAIKHKDIRKEEYLEEIQGKKSRFYNNKKQDRMVKQEQVRAKQIEDEREVEKRRRIMELIEEDQQKQLEQRKKNELLQLQARKEDFVAKEKQRLEKLKEEQEQKKKNNQYILQREKEKLEEIQRKKREAVQKEKQRQLIKELKLKQAQQNRKRLQKIQQFEKNQKLQKYHLKVQEIEQQRKEQKIVKVIRQPSRETIESKIIEENSLDKHRPNSQEKPSARIQALKKEAKKNPIEAKQKLKMEEVAKLIENLKVQCNKEEYLLMKEQEAVQRQREQLQKTAQNVAQLRRLQKIHGVERARFQQKLTALMKANQEKVEVYREELLR